MTDGEKTPIDGFLDTSLNCITKKLVEISQSAAFIKLQKIPGSEKFYFIEKKLEDLTRYVKSKSKEYKIMEIRKEILDLRYNLARDLARKNQLRRELATLQQDSNIEDNYDVVFYR